MNIVLLSNESKLIDLNDPGLRAQLLQQGYALPDPGVAESAAPAPVLAGGSEGLV